jgi:geranylgeranyl reductase family protein
MTIDVAVIGAGPSGAWSAYRLARAGARVVLFDPSHPREKPCGGGVTGRALALVRDGVDGAQLPRVDVDRTRFVDVLSRAAPAHQHGASVPLDVGALSIFSREAFDRRLLESACEAGAHLIVDRVSRLERDRGGFQIQTARGTWRAPRIIGADGANGLVRRRMSQKFDRSQLSVATGFFVHGVTSREVLLEFVTNPPGYLWSFPRVDHLAVGICASADAGVSADVLRARAATWIQRTGVGRGGRLVPYAWPIPSLSAHAISTTATSGDGWLLVGDAAGLVDPITREGIFFALLSADHAAAAIVEGRDVSAGYDRRLRELRAELARAARLKPVFFRPAFVELLLTALQNSSRIRDVMADLVAGTQSYRGLKYRLAKTGEFGLAWRLLRSAYARRRERRPGRGDQPHAPFIG